MVAVFFSVTCLLSTNSMASGKPLDPVELVRGHAESAIKSYARSRGWVNYDYTVTPWVQSDEMVTCELGLSITSSGHSGRAWGRVPYEITCEQPAWAIRARADTSLIVPVVVAKRNISRNEPLSNNTLRLKTVDLSKVYTDFVTDIRHVRGMRARRALRQDQVLSMNHVIAPYLVEKNDRVLIKANGGGVEASMAGTALESGSKGQGIRVRNLASGKVITAWVSGRGTVESRF